MPRSLAAAVLTCLLAGCAVNTRNTVTRIWADCSSYDEPALVVDRLDSRPPSEAHVRSLVWLHGGGAARHTACPPGTAAAVPLAPPATSTQPAPEDRPTPSSPPLDALPPTPEAPDPPAFFPRTWDTSPATTGTSTRRGTRRLGGWPFPRSTASANTRFRR